MTSSSSLQESLAAENFALQQHLNAAESALACFDDSPRLDALLSHSSTLYLIID
jgi:hypothetical protein